jgi:hypothetical protein
VAHPQTDGGRITNAPSFLFRNEAAGYGADESHSSSFSSSGTDRKRPRFTLHTSSFFLIRNEAAAVAAAQSEEEEEEQPPVAIYGRNNKLLVPGREQGILTEEDPAAVADGAAAMLMSQQTEPTLQPPTNIRSSRSVGPPEKQPWTFGGSYWPSRK